MGFGKFWAADTVSLVGSYVTTVALPSLAIVTLQASEPEVGLVQAARWLPYLLFGLIAGVLVDRWQRLPLLVSADLVRALLLALVPLLHAIDLLNIPVLIGIVFVFGALSLVYDAAHQSFLPSLVPAQRLTWANARLEQTNAVAQTAGQAFAGWLVKVLGAPLAFLLDAISYLVSGLLLATLKTPERRTPHKPQVREGLRWVYRHETLAPLAITSHIWFLFNGMVVTLFPLLVLRTLGLGELVLGITFALGGVGGLLGASLSTKAEMRFGAGPAIIVGRWLTPIGYLAIPFATNATTGVVLLCAAQFVFGFSIGLDSPVEMSYRQTITPARLQGRMNATMRSVNRGMIVVGAPVGGLIADVISLRAAFWVAIAGLGVQAVAITVSKFRHARLPTP
ncbi:MFS transporter [Kibdelosporangium aridum]|uniref:Predicted arabinose efflux permease, MFS family n=1 Tax=Kibdelosporangium aridum TaxID=2030 RepID=A0A1Y5XJM8_KIBAR|nr:MFS transporter [Kibdelosporangium aridum]SMC95731.1 Predicted arabinose efflux permease, MFS family [Kibdelosporangium aridum]